MPEIKELLGKESLLAIKDYVDAVDATKVDKADLEIIKITWSDLKSLRDNGQLISGRFYRITDYTCTTTTSNTSSAGHVFDIIVRADSVNKLNEEASAIQHEGDTYFSACKLEAWKLWYCLDNDATRFTWADSTNGKGVIYRMIDEFGNDVPYDFKNILFTRSGKYTNAYTFTCKKDNEFKDASLSLESFCYSNTIKVYRDSASQIQKLNFNVFYTQGLFLHAHGILLNCNCNNNTFGANCNSTIFGTNCYENTISTDCGSTKFGNNCINNIISSTCFGNTFGENCRYITLNTNNRYNKIGSFCSYITLPSYSNYVEIKNNCNNITLSSTSTGSSSNYLQNITINNAVSGDSNSNRKIITINRNLSYETAVTTSGIIEYTPAGINYRSL